MGTYTPHLHDSNRLIKQRSLTAIIINNTGQKVSFRATACAGKRVARKECRGTGMMVLHWACLRIFSTAWTGRGMMALGQYQGMGATREAEGESHHL